ncbi:MAG: hypothetical protein M1415_04160, partial [Firmicutes bacterium]|nr:hypothetical protein [Bacillota bacterium]
ARGTHLTIWPRSRDHSNIPLNKAFGDPINLLKNENFDPRAVYILGNRLELMTTDLAKPRTKEVSHSTARRKGFAGAFLESLRADSVEDDELSQEP